MKTILPVDYMFSSQNVLTPDRMAVGFRDEMTYIQSIYVYWGIFIVFYLLMAFYFMLKEGDDITTAFKRSIIALVFPSIITLCISLSIGNPDRLNQPIDRQYENNCEFRLSSDSNLVVKQDKHKHPIYKNENTRYPYRLYVKDNSKDDKLIYLGQTDGRQVNLNDSTKTSKLFTAYYYYVQKHHLNNRFNHKLYFEKDPNVLDADGVPQYVLKGDGITLKIKPNKASTYQIYTDKD